jgi:hypothetical protein
MDSYEPKERVGKNPSQILPSKFPLKFLQSKEIVKSWSAFFSLEIDLIPAPVHHITDLDLKTL